jgi:hypothetical protein
MRIRLLACLLSSPSLLAQQMEPSVPPAMVVNRTAGLQMLDGELWGGADGYKVRFGQGGFEFTPALGSAAPRNYPMTFHLESIGRGSERVPVGTAEPRHAGLCVEYDRGQVVERYDLGVEAMEQSFRFASRPPGSGDLVVRGRIRTDMLVAADEGGLRFEQPGIGGFRMGAVTGIDAKGVRVQGTVRHEDGIVELSLPAEFVDRAELPFVLDPLIGSGFGLNLLTGFDDREPLAAFDVTNDCYLVIWSNIFSATDTDINGQRISRAGSLLGTRVFVETSTAREFEPGVANLNGRNAFVVVYNRNGDILARSVSAAAGAVSAGVTIAGGASNQHSPSIGGDSFFSALSVTGNSVCVWESDADNAVMATRVVVLTDLSVGPSGTVHTLSSGAAGRPSRPRISKHGGSSRRWLVAFERQFADKDPWAIVVDSAGSPLTSQFQIDAAAGNDVNPEVDGDGTNWVVAWQHEVAVRNHDLFARSLSLAGSPATLIGTPAVRVDIGQLPQVDELFPSVIRTGGSTLIGIDFMFLPLFGDTAALASLDPFHCAACENVASPHVAGAGAEGTPFGCSALSGGGPPDDALLVWMFITASSPTNADIAAQFWRSADGAVTNLFGGCGTGGTAQATCVRVPNPGFVHRLRGATPNAGTFLLQSLGQEADTCGTCTRVPALAGVVALFFFTDGEGNAAFNSPIPDIAALRGLVQFDQWLTLRAGGSCSQFQIDMSNALRIVIE